MGLNESIKLINNYVFQNRFKYYFNNDISNILYCLSTISKIDKAKSVPYMIDGTFGLKRRTIYFPNFISYAYVVKKICSENIVNFGKIGSTYNRMLIDYDKRKFASNSYTAFLDEQLELLRADYDKLYKIDIQSFYKSIYTHVFEKLDDNKLGCLDENIRVFNEKKTNGLLMGNLLSTYSANEIMEDLSKKLENVFVNCKILFFSDQFYIFYNNSDYDDSFIFETVKNILATNYYEFKINNLDSKIYTHEDLIKEKDFIRMVSDLYIIQKSCTKKINDSLENLVHFFNSFVEKYYLISESKRLSFVEVVLRNVFSSPVNLYRLSRMFSNQNFDKESNRIISILILLLKLHPSLIVFYIDVGLWYIMEKYSSYFSLKGNEIKKYFENKLIKNINFVEAVYYFHICYLLTSNVDRETYCLIFYNKNKNKNQLLDSIIVETCNIKEHRDIIFSYKYNENDWLINYTKFMQIRFYLPVDASSSCFVKTLNNCKISNIKLVKSLENIVFDSEKLKKFNEVESKLKNVQ